MPRQTTKSYKIKRPEVSTGAGSRSRLAAQRKLEGENSVKASLEQRGLAVITTSGALVTLLFGLGALSTKSAATFDLSSFAASVLAIALVLFIAAAICALMTNRPLEYMEVLPDQLEDRINDPADDPVKDIALTRVKELRSAREKNGQKSTLLQWAMRLEVLAVLAVAVAVWDLLQPF